MRDIKCEAIDVQNVEQILESRKSMKVKIMNIFTFALNAMLNGIPRHIFPILVGSIALQTFHRYKRMTICR